MQESFKKTRTQFSKRKIAFWCISVLVGTVVWLLYAIIKAMTDFWAHCSEKEKLCINTAIALMGILFAWSQGTKQSSSKKDNEE
jgi:hypothetical protein